MGKSDEIFAKISTGLSSMSPSARDALVKDVNGVYLFKINTDGGVKQYLIDLKQSGTCKAVDNAQGADITISVDDAKFADMAEGRLQAETAFMNGDVKISGNIMLGMKLGTVLQTAAGPGSKL